MGPCINLKGRGPISYERSSWGAIPRPFAGVDPRRHLFTNAQPPRLLERRQNAYQLNSTGRGHPYWGNIVDWFI